METFAHIDWVHIALALGLIVFGYFFSKRISHVVDRTVTKRFSRHQAMLARRLVFYTIFILFCISALHQIGFKMTVLLGAAGVFTVALSFASQTAASNLVSGIFLIFEHPFKVGDTIEVKGYKGVVDSIDLLSTKIKTADNMRVRVPNEAIIKSEIINSSYFKTRRTEILINVATKTDIQKVKSILLNLANSTEGMIKEPAPSVVINNVTHSSVELKLMVWTTTKIAETIRSHLLEEIQKQFEKEQIDMQA